MRTQFAENKTQGSTSLHGVTQLSRLCRAACQTILLVSNDSGFHQDLRSRANRLGLLVVRAEDAVAALAILRAAKPEAVLLDLDLPDEAAWQIAELMLSEPCCPAVILLTGRTAQFDMRTSIRAGSLVNKRQSPKRLLEIIEENLELPEANRAERNTIQRVLVRWLRPSGWEGQRLQRSAFAA
jgi:DNA-binding response OmpR family regulator